MGMQGPLISTHSDALLGEKKYTINPCLYIRHPHTPIGNRTHRVAYNNLKHTIIAQHTIRSLSIYIQPINAHAVLLFAFDQLLRTIID